MTDKPTPDDELILLDLFIDGPEIEHTIGWSAKLDFNFDRFRFDDRYAAIVSDHVSRALNHLAEEIRTIGVITPTITYGPEGDRLPCEYDDSDYESCWCEGLDYLIHIREDLHEKRGEW